MLNEKQDVFSIWENLKKEKKDLDDGKSLSTIQKKKVLIIDGMNCFLRCWTAIPTLNINGLHTGGLTGFLKSVGAAIKMFDPDRLVIVFDGVGGSMKRRKIYPEYKNHRRTKVRLNRIYEDTAFGDEEVSLKKQLQRLMVYLQHLPCNNLAIENVEADDTIAFLALQSFKDWDVIIQSADRDFLQLCNDHIKVWSPTKKRIYGPEEVLEEYKIRSDNFVIYRSLSGDKSDNIDPIKGCGIKTIIKAFPVIGQENIKLDLIKEICNSNLGGKYKVYDTILENWSDVERNYALSQLSDTNLSTIAQLHIGEVLSNPIPRLNRFELVKMLSGDSLLSNIPNAPAWLTTCFEKLDNFIPSNS